MANAAACKAVALALWVRLPLHQLVTGTQPTAKVTVGPFERDATVGTRDETALAAS